MSSGRIVGLDINDGMLAVARSIPMGGGPLVEWMEGSALQLPFPEDAFDLVLCQLGLQFFPNQSLALNEMFRVLRTEGRVAVSVYSAIENTPVAHGLVDALDRHLGPGASKIKRSEHSFTAPSELHHLATKAGFRDVTVETVTQTIRFTSPREYVRLQIAATPMAVMVAEMESAEREAVIDGITNEVKGILQNSDGEELSSPQEAFVMLGKK
jgi:ubiquinone/menaquinone biosynthesis C-methylase UbiE